MRRLSLPGTAGRLIVLAVAALIAGVLGYVSAGDDAASRPAGTIEAPAVVRGIVQSATGSSLTLTTDDGPRTLDLPAGVSIESLRPIELPDVRAGDWLNAGAVPNAQTLFALTGLIVIPADRVQAPDR